jgi:hypothetical protein
VTAHGFWKPLYSMSDVGADLYDESAAGSDDGCQSVIRSLFILSTWYQFAFPPNARNDLVSVASDDIVPFLVIQRAPVFCHTSHGSTCIPQSPRGANVEPKMVYKTIELVVRLMPSHTDRMSSWAEQSPSETRLYQ